MKTCHGSTSESGEAFRGYRDVIWPSWLGGRTAISAAPPPSVVPTVSPEGLDNAWKVLSLVNEWVKHAETKLGVIFAFLGVLAAGQVALLDSLKESKPHSLIILLAGSVCLFISLAFSVFGLLPRMRIHCSAGANYVFYGWMGDSCNDLSQVEFKTRQLSKYQSAPDLFDDLSQQIRANSQVAVRKYKAANRALACGCVALILTFAAPASQMI